MIPKAIGQPEQEMRKEIGKAGTIKLHIASIVPKLDQEVADIGFASIPKAIPTASISDY